MYPWAATALIFVLTSQGGSDGAAPIIPIDRRIPASIISTLTAPADQPMHMPTDVAIDPSGRVFVADGANDRILRFTSEGAFSIAIARIGDQELNRPVGLTIDSAGLLWIADTGNHRLVVASGEGKLIETINLPTSAQGEPADPTDVAVTADQKRIYVVDNDNHRLIVRDVKEKRWSSLGGPGRGLGQFQWPFMVSFRKNGELLVTEAVGARVQRLTPDHHWSGQIGTWGVELGRLYRPKGVAVDPGGRIYVSDSTLGVVQTFDANGAVLGVLTDKGGTPLRFEHPMGMSFDQKARLHVVELKANRVAIVLLGNPGEASSDDVKKDQP